MKKATETAGRVTLEIDLAVLNENACRLAAAVAPAGVIAVLKADAYGLGMRRIAQTLVGTGIAAIAVADLREALEATGLGVPVLLLGTVLPDEVDSAIATGVRLPLADLASARHISAAACRLGRTAVAHLAVDTGMGRLGIPYEEAVPVVRDIVRLPGLEVEGVYSHFPMANPDAEDFTLLQVKRMTTLLGKLAAENIRPAWRHMANSDAIHHFPVAYHAPFTHVRAGIDLYGSFNPRGREILGLRSVLTLTARLSQVRMLPAGRTIGYGATYTCRGDTRVGTVAAGYADGLPLALSNRGRLLLRGCVCPILGRVSMDYTTISLAQVPDATVGDTVFCLGGPGPDAVGVEEWAKLKETHPYEVLCSIGPRAERRYRNDQSAALEPH